MKVIFSIPCEFGSWGMGYTGYQIAKALYNNYVLQKVLCPSYVSTTISSGCFCPTYPSIAKLVYKLPNLYIGLQGTVRNLLHDFLSLSHIRQTDIFYGWAGSSYFQMRKAKQLGAITILENPTSHIKNRIIAINTEEELLGFTKIKPIMLNYCLKEYEIADYIRVPSEYAYKSFIKYGVSEKKLILIPYGVDLEKFYPPKDKKFDKFKILYIGGITPYKGVHYLLEAVYKLKVKYKLKLDLVLVGHMFRKGLKILKKYTKYIEFEYYKFSKHILHHYHDATVFVFPSIDEGSALVTYEALACGLPVITTFEAGSVVRDGKEGFIVPARSPNTIAEKILYLYYNHPLIKQMSEAAYERAKEFTWEKIGEEIVKKFLEIQRVV